jgi:methylphosphotriester-DNA--protein-cysteine methyltransferase
MESYGSIPAMSLPASLTPDHQPQANASGSSLITFDQIDDNTKWRAVQNRDSAYDNIFIYAVQTTKIYCRPICKARLARRSNVRFYSSAAEAEKAGFRACKRCKPQLEDQLMPEEQAVKKIRAFIAERATAAARADAGSSAEKETLETMAKKTGLSKWHFHRVFKRVVGVTPVEYARLSRGDSLHSSRANAESGDGAALTGNDMLPLLDQSLISSLQPIYDVDQQVLDNMLQGMGMALGEQSTDLSTPAPFDFSSLGTTSSESLDWSGTNSRDDGSTNWMNWSFGHDLRLVYPYGLGEGMQ